jgi:uncharacterized protein (TIGR01244 family)
MAGRASQRRAVRLAAGLAAAALVLPGAGAPAWADDVGALLEEPLAPGPEAVGSAEAWGAAHNVTRLGRLRFSAQPDRVALAHAKAAGVEVVINLRPDAEMEPLDFDERAAVEDLGMTYVHVPVPGDAPFPPEALDALDRAVAENEGREIWLHCSTGNRAAGWLATHLVRREGMEVDDALAVARRAGITKPEIEERVRAALGAEAPAASDGGAGSSTSPSDAR